MSQRDDKCRQCGKPQESTVARAIAEGKKYVIYEKWNPISRLRFARIFCNDECLEQYKGSEKEKKDDLERMKYIEGHIETW